MNDTKKSLSKTKTSKKTSDQKKTNFNSDKRRKEIEEQTKKQEKKEEQYKKLEAYISESGLTLAFNIIFAELISKQILPENFFSYTAMRLKQIGKEIEGMQTKISKTVENPKNDDEGNEGEKNDDDDEGILMTQQKKNNFIFFLFIFIKIFYVVL